MTDVGICGTCGGAVTLRIDHGARRAACPCGTSTIPAEFFEQAVRVSAFTRPVEEVAADA